MPSVEYNQTKLVYEEVEQTFEDPETGETQTITNEVQKNPYEVRISKWLETDGNYKLYGFVEVTEWGQNLYSQASPYDWITNNFQTASAIDQAVIDEWLQGIQAVQNAELGEILSFANISPVNYTATGDDSNRMDFTIQLEGQETFDIEWLRVDFDPKRGGS